MVYCDNFHIYTWFTILHPWPFGNSRELMSSRREFLGLYKISNFYRAKLCVAQYCQGKLSVRPSVRLSVCDVEVSCSYGLEFVENNFTADKPNLFTLCRPQHDGSIPKGAPPNFSRNRSGVGKNVDFWHLSRFNNNNNNNNNLIYIAPACRMTSAAITLKRCKIGSKLLLTTKGAILIS